MPKKTTPRDLRRLAVKLHLALGRYWTIRVLTQKEARALKLKTPMAHLEARCFLGYVYVFADGEVYIEGNPDKGQIIFQMPVSWRHETMVERVLEGLRTPPHDP